MLMDGMGWEQNLQGFPSRSQRVSVPVDVGDIEELQHGLIKAGFRAR